jgi:hypothetical protein
MNFTCGICASTCKLSMATRPMATLESPAVLPGSSPIFLSISSTAADCSFNHTWICTVPSGADLQCDFFLFQQSNVANSDGASFDSNCERSREGFTVTRSARSPSSLSANHSGTPLVGAGGGGETAPTITACDVTKVLVPAPRPPPLPTTPYEDRFFANWMLFGVGSPNTPP